MQAQPKYLDIDGTVSYTTLSRSVIYELIKLSDFPRQFKFKNVEKRVVWSVEELDDWMSKNLTKQTA